MKIKISLLFVVMLGSPVFLKSQVPEFSFKTYIPGDSLSNNKWNKYLESRQIRFSEKESRLFMKKLKQSNIDPYDYLFAAYCFHIKIGKKERKQLVEEMVRNETNSEAVIYIRQVFSKKIDFNYVISKATDDLFDPASLLIIDLNGDRQPDLILIRYVYFGPSYGYKIYMNQNGTFKYISGISGYFTNVESKNDTTRLEYCANIISYSETNVTFTLLYDLKKNSGGLSSKLYFARQTVVPPVFSAAVPFISGDSVELRTSPEVDTASNPDFTHTISGNLVARYAKNASGYILYRQNGWAFVAFNPENQPVERSLGHGLDEDCYLESETYNSKCLRPFVCGWIKWH